MTVLLALLDVQGADDSLVRALLARSLDRDAVEMDIQRPSSDVVLAAASPKSGMRAGPKSATSSRYTVVADASFYFLESLGVALREKGVRVPTPSENAAAWVLAALEAFGEAGMSRLEGDFAWMAWDNHEQRFLAARDHAGARPLFFASGGNALAVSSLARTLRNVPGITSALNLVTIAEDACDVGPIDARETPFTSIVRVPSGHALGWSRGRSTSLWRWWELPIFDQPGRESFEDAGEILLTLIEDAVKTRTDLANGTAVLLSGGYDSTAVYGAGQNVFTKAGLGAVLNAVSVSHPEGDPGREDELILATTQRWGREPNWVSIDSVPALDDPHARALRRDEPFVHTYELWNRALARSVYNVPARVALNGLGGDFWFSLGLSTVADHVRRFQWLRFRREWRALMGRMSFYEVFKYALRPNIPSWGISLGRRLTGKVLGDSSHRRIPSWVRADFVKRSGMDERRYVRVPRRRGESHAGAEQAWYLQSPFIERVSAHVDGFFADAGVEMRAPLMDSRIIRYAATRPASDSLAGNWENKRLLRRSVRALLPESVTGPRATRTGLPLSYFHRTMRAHLQQARAEFTSSMRLADLGILDANPYLSLIDKYLAGESIELNVVVALSYAAHTEWWLRSDP